MAEDPAPESIPTRSAPSLFETVVTFNRPVLESLLAQVPTETILRLYQTSYYLRQFLASSPTAWKYMSFRLFQPAATTAAVTNNATGNGPRQSSNYALDQLLINVINAVSTRLTSLELDNTAVSGATLVATVLTLRRDSLQHLSVRGCKNVSLKYHINPWLQMHALAREGPVGSSLIGFDTLALKSLYTYRCRHHRRRPYLPASLVRKESDSEPTHELVKICHTLDIWTDTAWCTSPGPRCYRRAMYVTSRIPQDSREVWVVYDRLWRSKNWLGPSEGANTKKETTKMKKAADCRFWESEEHALNGEALGGQYEGKDLPVHLRHSHRRFIENIRCDNCSELIGERCESCSVMMHCAGCRKTLCASCAFDRPYLRNRNAFPEERNKFWWAPGCAVSPCSMMDQDPPPANTANHPQPSTVSTPPVIKFKWCCTEPVFSGGGGITFTNGNNRETDRIRAAPLPSGHGWEDPEFCSESSHANDMGQNCKACSGATLEPSPKYSLAGRWGSLDEFFDWQASASNAEDGHPIPVPRSLCDECHTSEQWNVKCKGCSSPLCVRHDMRDRLKFRVCGYKDIAQERQDYRFEKKAVKLMETKIADLKELDELQEKAKSSGDSWVLINGPNPQQQSLTGRMRSQTAPMTPTVTPARSASAPFVTPRPITPDPEAENTEVAMMEVDLQSLLQTARARRSMTPARSPVPIRPQSRGSNATDSASRSSSPAPEGPASPEPPESAPQPPTLSFPLREEWRGCESFFCPPSRPPGDRRRRCATPMKQCTQCKVHVCSDCVSLLDSSCPCKGCRVPQSEDSSSQSTTDQALFFCPNCRWDRMVTGKCKRKTAAFLTALSEVKRKPRKRRDRNKKPLNQRRGSDASAPTHLGDSDAVDGLADFFATLNNHTEDDVILPTIGIEGVGDLAEIRDVGILARDLIRRIQSLRTHFRPGSAGALALPNIRLEDLTEIQEAAQEDSSGSDDDEEGAGEAAEI